MKDPWRDLGLDVPDAEDMLAHFVAEHSLDSGFNLTDGDLVAGAVGFSDASGVTCAPWPSDRELLAARMLIPDGCGLTDAEKRSLHPSRRIP